MVSSVYFNRSRAPVTVTLKTGQASLVRPKGFLEVTAEQDGSPSLLAMVRKGILQRRRVQEEPAPVPQVQSAPPARPIQEPPKKSSPAKVEPASQVEMVQEVPSLEWPKTKLLAFLEAAGLEADPKRSKASLLRKIQEAGL